MLLVHVAKLLHPPLSVAHSSVSATHTKKCSKKIVRQWSTDKVSLKYLIRKFHFSKLLSYDSKIYIICIVGGIGRHFVVQLSSVSTRISSQYCIYRHISPQADKE